MYGLAYHAFASAVVLKFAVFAGFPEPAAFVTRPRFLGEGDDIGIVERGEVAVIDDRGPVDGYGCPEQAAVHMFAGRAAGCDVEGTAAAGTREAGRTAAVAGNLGIEPEPDFGEIAALRRDFGEHPAFPAALNVRHFAVLQMHGNGLGEVRVAEVAAVDAAETRDRVVAHDAVDRDVLRFRRRHDVRTVRQRQMRALARS